MMIVHRDLSKSDSLHQNQTTMLSILFLLVAMQRLGMAMEYRLTSDDLNGRRSYGQGIDFPDGPEWLPAAIKEARQHAACSTGLTSLSTEGLAPHSGYHIDGPREALYEPLEVIAPEASQSLRREAPQFQGTEG
ncbi:uncharacterized protein VDAG_04643 [Verticillium dahliae VdLs.17]|uniref:Uncharacterized protein n=1 Tax=Verticillium dahliae (strain VdLs.17 / ATCC MYA-4575 / FGSC 10137) TaxID=498257 RepID=G2X3Q6_VERDV|nr:uncharacterized protein VDAG_04643 [Verticillium dahliae VdLs.17]EGY23205.1 hypothetical protein VDAG_04643 [Verticillium dahliae VdLs.17]KAH6689343.1 hypothetical protein EV126DRAFT_485143 [Verticillium dahliae]